MEQNRAHLDEKANILIIFAIKFREIFLAERNNA
jgi:hypothetical protein